MFGKRRKKSVSKQNRWRENTGISGREVRKMADNSFLDILKARFEKHMQRHPDILWDDVAARLSAHPDAMQAIQWMEETGGEPDVIGTEDGAYLFADCTAESPAGRRSLCYDDAALRARKKNLPAGSAEGQARAAGVDMMTEAQYRLLQSTGEYDLKTSSWIFTPQAIRSLGGALFCERRYNAVFVFHNGADSYYGVRGWRGVVRA